MLAGPFLPDFLPFPLSVSWSSTHNCSINISHIFYFRELLFPAQVIKTFLCRCSTFHLHNQYRSICSSLVYNKDNPKVFCGARQFLQDVARMFSVGWKIGISSPSSKMPCCVLLYSLLWLPYTPLPQSQSKNHATLSGLEYLALFPSQNQPNCYKIHYKRPKVEL